MYQRVSAGFATAVGTYLGHCVDSVFSCYGCYRVRQQDGKLSCKKGLSKQQ